MLLIGCHVSFDKDKQLVKSTEEAIQPDNNYNMSGNSISVKTLDLSQDFSKITEQLKSIVAEYFT